MRWLFILTLLLSTSFSFAAQTVYHVDQDGVDGAVGNDSNPGTQAQPWATIDKARQAVRLLTNGNCGSVTAPIIVTVHGQRAPNYSYYFQTTTLTFTGTGSPNDNGCSALLPVVYQVPSGENVIVSGGRKITGWSCPNNPPLAGDVCTVTPSPTLVNAEGFFYATPLNNISGTARRFRHRLGAAGNGTQYRFFPTANNGAICGCAVPPCLDRFQYDPADPVAAFLNLNGAYPVGDIEVIDNERWQEAHMRVSNIDTTNKCVLLTGNLSNGGNDGYLLGHRYYIENVLAGTTISNSLGQGNWYLDRRSSPFTLYYVTQSGENPTVDNIIVPQTTAPVIATGLQYNHFYGFIFAHDNTVVPASGFAGLQNNYNLEPGEFFQCLNCTGDYFIGNTFTQTMGIGIAWTTDATSTSSDMRFLSNSAYDLGTGTLYAGRFVPGATDSDTNVLNNFIIRNNKATGTGRRFAGECSFCVLLSHDGHFDHNEISYTYGTGSTFCIPTPVNCQPTGATPDSSGIFRIGVVGNLIHDINQGYLSDSAAAGVYMASYYARGNFIFGNTVYNISGAQKIDPVASPPGFGGNGFYIDNVTCCVLVDSNIAYNVSYSAFQNTRSVTNPLQPNLVHNNIFAWMANGVYHHPLQASLGPNGQPVQQVVATNNYAIFDKTYNSPIPFYQEMACGPFNVAAPLVKNTATYDFNLYWNSTTDISAAGYTTFAHRTNSSCAFTVNNTWAQWQAVEDANGVVPLSNPFVSPGYPNYDFTLAGAPQVGFMVFPLGSAGVDANNQPPIPLTVPNTRVITPFDASAGDY